MAHEGPRHRRAAERMPILGKVQGEVKVYQPITIKEISHSGAQIETEFPFVLDSLCEFRLTIGNRFVVVKGRIAHCRISDMDGDVVFYQSGAEFVDVSDRVSRAIDDYIADVTRARQPL